MMELEKFKEKSRKEMDKTKYLDFTDDELEYIYNEYYHKVEPFLDVIAEFKLPTKGVTVKQVRAVLRISEKPFRLMRKVFSELDEALDADKSYMKLKAQLDLQKAIVASEYKNAKMIEMQLKRYDDEYSSDGERKVELPDKLEIVINDVKKDDEELDEYAPKIPD